MKQEITNELRQRIYAAYYGSELQFKPSFTSDKVVIKEWGVQPNGLHFSYKSDGYSGAYHGGYNDCQLLLTPLSKITDEHAIEVYKVVFTPVGGTKDLIVSRNGKVIHIHSKYAENGSLSNGWMGIYEEGLEIIYRDDNRMENPDTYRALLIWDYLRSQGYDCGHGAIPSLIESHIAIDKTI